MTPREIVYDALLDSELIAAHEAQWDNAADLVLDRLEKAGCQIMVPAIYCNGCGSAFRGSHDCGRNK